MQYYEAIRKARIEAGLTIKQLGEMIGIKESAMSRYERGQSKPSILVVIAIADALDVSLDYLVGRSNKK